MADSYTSVGNVGAWEIDAYEAIMRQPLRAMLVFDAAADVSPVAETTPGLQLTWTETDDFAVATTALNEITDSDAVSPTTSTVTLTITEYGNHAKTTKKLRGSSLFPVDPTIAEKMARNAGETVDILARTQLFGGTNVIYGGNATSVAELDATDNLDADDIRQTVAQLRTAKVNPRHGSLFLGYMHPDVHYDLITETGDAAWRAPQVQQDLKAIENDLIGNFAGVQWISNPNCPLNADAGAVNVDEYQCLVIGKQALAKRWSKLDGNGPMPVPVLGPVTDPFRRHHPIGWYWFGGYGRHREAAIRRISVSSSIGANV